MKLEDVIAKVEESYERMDAHRNEQRHPWDRGYHEGYTDGLEAVLKLLENVEGQHYKPMQAVKLRVRLGERVLLEQLAEESAELGMAALKLIRAKGLADNPANISEQNAKGNFYEEIMDVLCVLMVILPEREWDDLMDGVYTYYKLDRWLKRLGGDGSEA